MSAVQPALFGAPQTQATSDDYYTPAWVFEAMAIRFDLDVAAPPGGVRWIPADRSFTVEDDGLAQPGMGRVWMNPPYSSATAWVRRFMEHRHGVCLVPMAKSQWFYDLWRSADGVATFPKVFDFIGGSISYAVIFAAFGDECVEAISRLGVVRVQQQREEQ